MADVNAALEKREAIRTWPMRGTVHLVPPADAHWMLDLMGVRRWPARRNAARPSASTRRPPSAASRCSADPRGRGG
jgi:hypothetical protein